MNPDTKLILEEVSKLSKRFDEVESKLESRFAKHEARSTEHDDRLERKLADLQISHDVRVGALERVAESFDSWRPEIEGTIDDIRLEVGKLNLHWERAVSDRPPPLLSMVPTVAEQSSAFDDNTKPSGHRVDNHHWVDGFKSVTTLVHPPVKGTQPDAQYLLNCARDRELQFAGRPPDFACDRSNFPLRASKLPFLSFYGDNPKLWISRCEDYFELYGLDSSLQVKFGAMHLKETASTWLQSVESRVRSCSWAEFCQLVLYRFGRNQYKLLVRQLLHMI